MGVKSKGNKVVKNTLLNYNLSDSQSETHVKMYVCVPTPLVLEIYYMNNIETSFY